MLEAFYEKRLSELQGKRCTEVFFNWNDIEPYIEDGNFLFTPEEGVLHDSNGDGWGDFRFNLLVKNVCDPAVNGGADVFYEHSSGDYGQITVSETGWVEWEWSEPVYYYGFDGGDNPAAIDYIYVVEGDGEITENLKRILQAKNDLKTVLESKNIEVGDALIDEYPKFVEQLEGKWVVPSGMRFKGDFTEFDGTGLDISDLTSLNNMFSFSSAFTTCNLDTWDFSKITNLSSMFYSCYSLQTIDLSGKNVESVKSTYSMFEGCSGLTEVNLSGWELHSCLNAEYMFKGCTSLVTANLSGDWHIYNMISYVDYLFDGCESLENLDLSGWVFGTYFDAENVNLNVCPNLTNLQFGTALKMSDYEPWYYMTYCKKLTKESVVSIFNGLWDYVKNPTDMTDTPTIQFNTALRTVIDDDTLAIATEKGWAIAYGETNS